MASVRHRDYTYINFDDAVARNGARTISGTRTVEVDIVLERGPETIAGADQGVGHGNESRLSRRTNLPVLPATALRTGSSSMTAKLPYASASACTPFRFAIYGKRHECRVGIDLGKADLLDAPVTSTPSAETDRGRTRNAHGYVHPCHG